MLLFAYMLFAAAEAAVAQNTAPVNLQIDRTYMLDLIDQVYKGSQSFSQKDIIYILGHTGVGKSSIINYLNYECQYHFTKNGFVPRDPTKQKAEPSKGVKAKTMIPTLHGIFCDLAGLEDNRSTEEKIAANLGLELSNKMAGSLKLMVVLDISDLQNTTNRHEAFLSMVELIVRVFRVKSQENKKDFLDKQDILFLFNKGDPRYNWTEKDIVEKIQEMIEEFKPTVRESLDDAVERIGNFFKAK